MNGREEQELKIREKIERNLEGKPEYVRGYINYMNDTSVRTKDVYLNIVLKFVDTITKDPSEYTFDDFNNYLSTIKYKENGEEKGKSNQIVVYSALKKYNEYLYKSKRTSEYFMRDINKPKYIESQKTIEKRNIGYLNEKEISKMYKCSTKDTSKLRKLDTRIKKRNKAIIYLFLSTGLRCSELTAINVDDFNYEKRTLTITGKRGKVRVFELSEEVAWVVDEWLVQRALRFTSWSDALFLSQRNERMCSTDISYIIKQIGQYVTDKPMSPHKLRATYGTQLYNETHDIYFVQECMGHDDPKTTELYVRGTKENTKKASKIMTKFMK